MEKVFQTFVTDLLLMTSISCSSSCSDSPTGRISSRFKTQLQSDNLIKISAKNYRLKFPLKFSKRLSTFFSITASLLSSNGESCTKSDKVQNIPKLFSFNLSCYNCILLEIQSISSIKSNTFTCFLCRQIVSYFKNIY